MAFMCMFFPAMVYCFMREKHFPAEYKSGFEKGSTLLFEYICGNVVINMLIIGSRIIVLHKVDNIPDVLNEYNSFAIKYMFLAITIALTLPYAEKYIREKVAISVEIKLKVMPASDGIKICIIALYAIGMSFLHFLRCLDNSFWLDEGFVVIAARKDWIGMLTYVAAHGHSPFHYAFAWILTRLFGESGFIYHISATLPYFLVIAVTMIMIRKWFGNKVSLILITLNTLLECAVIYNLEIRMYAWCQFFILLSYLMAYGLYNTEKNRYIFFMAIFSLGAVYSHYFALASIGLIYLMLFLFMLSAKKSVWKILVSGGSVVLLLTPWLIFAKKTRGVIMSNYEISQVSYSDCIRFIFSSKYSLMLLALFFVTLLIKFIYDYNIVNIQTNETKKKYISVRVVLNELKLTNEWIWIFSGILGVFGTIIVSETISTLVYPIICLRYLYPSFIILWLLMGINISNLRWNNLWTLIFILFIFVICFPNYFSTIRTEKAYNQRLTITLKATQPKLDKTDYIYTNILQFNGSVADVYYPETPHGLLGYTERGGTSEKEAFLDLDKGTDYWLFLENPISVEVSENLDDQNLTAQLVVDMGFIGTGNVWIYKIVDEGKEKVTAGE